MRGIPEDNYEGLRQVAARNHSSMQEQVRLIIERVISDLRAARHCDCPTQ
ncbi:MULTISPECIES: FitA-like ribbon-helix-helix domain-containing protein [unclassified Synechococcus]